MLEEAYGDEMNDPNKFLWFNRFFEGNEQVKDESRSGAPSSVRNEENLEEVRMQVLQDQQFHVSSLQLFNSLATLAFALPQHFPHFSHCLVPQIWIHP